MPQSQKLYLAKRSIKISGILLALLLSNQFGIAQSVQDNLRTEIEQIIFHDTNIALDNHKGFMVGVIDGDSTYIFTFLPETSPEAPLSTYKYFQLGGASKPITAYLLSALQSQGLLDLNQDINTYLPPTLRNSEKITWMELLTHRSGLPKLPTGLGSKQQAPQNPYAHYTHRDLLAFYSNYEVGQKEFNYSHLNYAVIGVLLEQILGSEHEALDSILQKGAGFADIMGKANHLEVGYSRFGNLVEPWTFQSYLYSEGLCANMEELLGFLRIQIEDQSLNLHEPVFKTGIRRTYITKGWYVLQPRHWFSIYTHGGNTDGYRAYLGFVRETKTGVAVLSRSSTDLNSLGLLILRMINHTWKRKKNE